MLDPQPPSMSSRQPAHGLAPHGVDRVLDIADALEACTRMTRHHSSTFYLGSRLFFGEKRAAVTVIYAVCRAGDDAVDEAVDRDDAKRRLRAWWQGVERAYAGEPAPNEPTELGLRWVLDRFDVPRHAFEELYLGLASDLDEVRVADMDELMLYCRRVAGVVGWLIAPIAGYRGGEATLQRALELGQAMQLTNILRDVGEDLRLGRCYLPADLLAAYDVDLTELRAGHLPPGYRELVERLAEDAHALYRSGWHGIPKLHGIAATAVGVAALNYEGILRKLRQNDYDNLSRRAYLRPLERLALIPRAVAGVYAGLV